MIILVDNLSLYFRLRQDKSLKAQPNTQTEPKDANG
jgi:hypothetical protein